MKRDVMIDKPVSSLTTYRLFGARLASNYSFKHLIITDTDFPDVTFSLVEASPCFGWENVAPVCVEKKDDEATPYLFVFRYRDYVIIRFPEVDFIIGEKSIQAYLHERYSPHSMELWLLGKVFSIWLELSGVPCLHASSVVVDDEAIGFLSSSHGGKSALAACLMKAGYPLLTDDILPVKREGSLFMGMPGSPSMRMWPDQAEYFLGSFEDLEVVLSPYSKRRVPVGPGGFGTFCINAQPLKAIYVPEKHNSSEEILITPIAPRDAFFELVKNSFVANIVEALGVDPYRMKLFSDLATHLALRRLSYPEGFHHLSRVRDAVLEDIGTL